MVIQAIAGLVKTGIQVGTKFYQEYQEKKILEAQEAEAAEKANKESAEAATNLARQEGARDYYLDELSKISPHVAELVSARKTAEAKLTDNQRKQILLAQELSALDDIMKMIAREVPKLQSAVDRRASNAPYCQGAINDYLARNAAAVERQSIVLAENHALELDNGRLMTDIANFRAQETAIIKQSEDIMSCLINTEVTAAAPPAEDPLMQELQRRERERREALEGMTSTQKLAALGIGGYFLIV